jgi:hypothetical protein
MNALQKLFVICLGILSIPAAALSQTPYEYKCGNCCYLACDYEPCSYNTWRCEMIDQVQQVQKCCYVPQYYCENVCTQYPHRVCETNCQMVPKYTFRIR